MGTTIAALATGNAVGGIGVIRISGEKAIQIANSVFEAMDHSSLLDLPGYHAKFGNIISNDEKIDNAIATVFRSPKSYTGEDVVELSVHGGIFIVEKTLEEVFKAGAVPAEPGEFTKRAFLNGKMDLTQAESVADLISAQGETAAKASFNLLQGSLSNKITNTLESLMDASALMSAWVDYPDEEIPELESDELQKTLIGAQDSLKELLDNYDNGQTVIQGIDTAIVGKPNAGKSTLMNLLVGKSKSIVTNIAGTTRDIVEDTVKLGNLVLHLSDTAGIRESDDVVESIGIQKAIEKISSASLILAIFDASRTLDDDDKKIIKACEGKKAIAIINKIDINDENNLEIESNFDNVLYICANEEKYLTNIEKCISNLLGVEQFDTSAPMLANLRQKKCCEQALEYITEAKDALVFGYTFDAINVMIDSSIDELLTLTGKKANTEVVNNIFSKFCVGK